LLPVKAKCIETLRQAGAIVDTKAPGDAAAFKGWLRQISQPVAEASKEGGFLGIGGVSVSEAEKGNAYGDFECAQTGGMIRCRHAANKSSPASLSAYG
jgi:hypothetical protein